ncbi:MAG: hypothetical protein M1818_003917 [Claussenomyces sp. TS43310]|nr:MAG: hypothetical protein M1818_003917 [Claussenomyces sp. TS43310]
MPNPRYHSFQNPFSPHHASRGYRSSPGESPFPSPRASPYGNTGYEDDVSAIEDGPLVHAHGRSQRGPRREHIPPARPQLSMGQSRSCDHYQIDRGHLCQSPSPSPLTQRSTERLQLERGERYIFPDIDRHIKIPVVLRERGRRANFTAVIPLSATMDDIVRGLVDKPGMDIVVRLRTGQKVPFGELGSLTAFMLEAEALLVYEISPERERHPSRRRSHRERSSGERRVRHM